MHAGAEAVSSKKICEHYGVSGRYYEVMLQGLVRHSILNASKGPRGGYTLAKEKRRTTLADIMKAYLDLKRDAPKETQAYEMQIIQNMLQLEEENCLNALEKVTIQDVCAKHQHGRNSQNKADFSI